jgi:hypothetical protein
VPCFLAIAVSEVRGSKLRYIDSVPPVRIMSEENEKGDRGANCKPVLRFPLLQENTGLKEGLWTRSGSNCPVKTVHPISLEMRTSLQS